LSLFCMSCFGDLRDLHSFPTRRSSDLRQAGLRVRSAVPGLAPPSCLIHPPPCAAFRHPPGFSPDGEGSGLFFKETLMGWTFVRRSEEHTSELQSRENLVCRLLLEKKKQ